MNLEEKGGKIGERCEAWSSGRTIDVPCAGVTLVEEHGVLRVTLLFSGVVGASLPDLELLFKGKLALMSHEEFAHPWHYDDNDVVVPRLDSEAWDGRAFPLLLVRGSEWLRSFSDAATAPFSHGTFAHLRIVSLDRTVDVLTAEREVQVK